MPGKLELIIGPMFSGKSTEILRRIRLLQVINKKVLIIKASIDNRYTLDKITTHNFDSVDCIVVSRLDEITDIMIMQYDAVVVDEGQFIPDLKTTVVRWLENYNLDIIVAGLDGDYMKNPIGNILELITHSDKVVKLCSLCNVCKDGTLAPFTFRTIISSDVILVGGAESYIPVCRAHYLSLSSIV
jgi:thymidine kinase